MATRASGRIVGIGVDGSASSLDAAHTSSIWRGGSWNHRNDRNNGTVRNDTHARRRMRGSIASNGWRMRSRRRRAALRAGYCHLAYRSNLQDPDVRHVRRNRPAATSSRPDSTPPLCASACDGPPFQRLRPPPSTAATRHRTRRCHARPNAKVSWLHCHDA